MTVWVVGEVVTAAKLEKYTPQSSVATFTSENNGSFTAITMDASVFDELSIISLSNAYTTVAAGVYLVSMYGLLSGQSGTGGGGIRVKRQNSGGSDQETLFQVDNDMINSGSSGYGICTAAANDRIVFMEYNGASGTAGTMAGRICITKIG